jgi:hypothetical protein
MYVGSISQLTILFVHNRPSESRWPYTKRSSGSPHLERPAGVELSVCKHTDTVEVQADLLQGSCVLSSRYPPMLAVSRSLAMKTSFSRKPSEI